MGDHELNLENANKKYSKDINMSNLNRETAWKRDSAIKHKELAERYSFKGVKDKCPSVRKANMKFLLIFMDMIMLNVVTAIIFI